MRLARFGLWLTVAAGLAHLEGAARACSCLQPPPPEEAREKADAVFEGRVVSREEVTPMRHRYAFEVVRYWKGELADSVTIVTASSSAACGRSYREGTAYLIYANKVQGEELGDNFCSRTREIDRAADDLVALGESLTPGAPKQSGETAENTEPPRIDPASSEGPPPAPPSRRGCSLDPDSRTPAGLLVSLTIGLLGAGGAGRRRRRAVRSLPNQPVPIDGGQHVTRFFQGPERQKRTRARLPSR